MKAHPFDRTPWLTYGFEKGQELEWFEWVVNYRNALDRYSDSMNDDRFSCDKTLKEYITIKDEALPIKRILSTYIYTNPFRPFHSAFLKSKKVDASEKAKLKTKLLKLYEEGENKDGKYYLSIVNAKV
ncbi:MAG: hypothetical protein RLZZ44_1152 [Bacteroidota bacterium]|jgi:hypothetical protein